jgi:hypothetical protein
MTIKRDRLTYILQDLRRSHERGYKVTCADVLYEWIAYAVAEHMGHPHAVAKDNAWFLSNNLNNITWDCPQSFLEICTYVERITNEQALKETKNAIKNTDSSE